MAKHVTNKDVTLDHKERYGMESLKIREISDTAHLKEEIMTVKEGVNRMEGEG